MKHFKIVYFAIIFCLAFALVGCKPEKHIPVKTLSLNEETVTLTVGETKKLVATLLVDEEQKEEELAYSSDNNNVATFVNGTITAVSAGNVEVKVLLVSDDKVFATAQVTVVNKKSQITFDLQEGSCENLPAQYEEGVGIELPTPTREGYKFLGWYFEGDLIESITKDDKGDFNLVAKWEKLTIRWNLTFELDGGEVDQQLPKNYIQGKGISIPTPYKNGFEFLGWFVGETRIFNVDENQKTDLTIVAKWEEIIVTHNITYILNDGVAATALPTSYAEKKELDLPAVTKENTVFMGWYLDGVLVTKIDGTLKEDIVLEARFKADKFNLALEFNGGSSKYATREEVVADFFKDYNKANSKGYSSLADISQGNFGDIDYHTFFTKTLEDGTPVRTKWLWLAKYLLKVSKRDLASNNCNYLGLTALVNETSYSGDAIYGISYAFRAFLLGKTFRPNSSYTSVDFSVFTNANGFWEDLCAEEVKEFTDLTEFTLPTPSKEFFGFDGWYDNPKFNGEKYTSLNIATMELWDNVKLYAKFNETTPVTKVTIDNKKAAMSRFDEYTLEWTVSPAEANIQAVKFTSSNNEIATVNNEGIITCLTNGRVTITCTSLSQSGASDSFDITITSPDHFEIAYNGNSYMTVGETTELKAQLIKQNGGTSEVEYTSLNPEIATVTSTGLVTAVKEGVASIRASVKGQASVFIDFGVTVVSNEISEVLKFVLDSHESNVFTRYELGIGAGKPAYYRDIIGSVSKVLYNTTYEENTQYEAVQAGRSNHGGTMTSVEFITVHYTGNMAVKSTASANANYFAAQSNDSSIHYVTGNDGIFHVLDNSLVGWHAGDGTSVPFTWSKTGVMYEESDPQFPVWGISENSKFTINGKETTISVPEGTTDKTKKVTDSKWINDMGLSFKVVDGEYQMGTTWWCYSQIAEGRICSKGGNLNSIGIESCVNPESDLWLTWQMTAQLVARLMDRYNLDITRVVGHHFFSAKDCPQPLLENDKEIWWEFIELVEQENKLATTFKDYTFEFKLLDGENVLTNGRVSELSNKAQVVSYKVTVTKASDPSFNEEITLFSALNSKYSKTVE